VDGRVKPGHDEGDRRSAWGWRRKSVDARIKSGQSLLGPGKGRRSSVTCSREPAWQRRPLTPGSGPGQALPSPRGGGEEKIGVAIERGVRPRAGGRRRGGGAPKRKGVDTRNKSAQDALKSDARDGGGRRQSPTQKPARSNSRRQATAFKTPRPPKLGSSSRSSFPIPLKNSTRAVFIWPSRRICSLVRGDK
jgi:hypothetical protein